MGIERRWANLFSMVNFSTFSLLCKMYVIAGAGWYLTKAIYKRGFSALFCFNQFLTPLFSLTFETNDIISSRQT
jgi:hypothetical protein